MRERGAVTAGWILTCCLIVLVCVVIAGLLGWVDIHNV